MGGGAIPECAGHWWRRSSGAWRNGGEGDAYPSSSAREGIRGGGGWVGGGAAHRRAVTAALAPPCVALRRSRARAAPRGGGAAPTGRSSAAAAARASPAVPLPGRMRRLFPAAAGRRGRRWGSRPAGSWRWAPASSSAPCFGECRPRRGPSPSRPRGAYAEVSRGRRWTLGGGPALSPAAASLPGSPGPPGPSCCRGSGGESALVGMLRADGRGRGGAGGGGGATGGRKGASFWKKKNVLTCW